MEAIEVSASVRDGNGKALRAACAARVRIPAVAYGKPCRPNKSRFPGSRIKAVLASAGGRNTGRDLDGRGQDKRSPCCSRTSSTIPCRARCSTPTPADHMDQPVT